MGVRVRATAVVAATIAATMSMGNDARAVEQVTDGGFEAPGLPAWTKTLNYPGFAVRNQDECRPGPEDCAFDPHTGAALAEFGDVFPLAGSTCPCPIAHSAQFSQAVTIPTGTTTLSFYAAWADGAGSSSLSAKIDGVSLYSNIRLDPATVYQHIDANLSAFANGRAHILAFEYSATGSSSSLSDFTDAWGVDDVSIDSPSPGGGGSGGSGGGGGGGGGTPVAPGQAAPACGGKQTTIIGTDGSDQISGTAAADVISALGGNDTVSALAANDVVCGGPGKDTLNGGKGKDSLLGQGGKDTLTGGGGKDICKGGKGKDTASKCEVEKSI